jgi:S-formylglutathione hydrolase FrmB
VPSRPTRRAVLVAGLGAGAVVVTGGAAVATGVVPGSARLRHLFADTGQSGTIPTAPEGEVRLEQMASAARGRSVGFWTAVPAGHGAGAGLPVCLVLHGASATTADYSRFGLGRFLTAAVRAGVPPFVLAGADGGATGWVADGGDDPQRMLREELPRWCVARGWDPARLAAYGWSLGGRGSLLLAEQEPGLLRAVSALSPAVRHDDVVITDADRLDGRRTALWCGTADALLPAVRSLAAAVPGGPAIASYAPGAHTRGYWDTVTPAAFAFVGQALTAGPGSAASPAGSPTPG